MGRRNFKTLQESQYNFYIKINVPLKRSSKVKGKYPSHQREHAFLPVSLQEMSTRHVLQICLPMMTRNLKRNEMLQAQPFPAVPA